MNKVFLALAFALAVQIGSAQDNSKQVSTADNVVYTSVEVAPEFSGGPDAFYSYLSSKIEVPNKKGARILLSFVVEKDGSLSRIEVNRGGSVWNSTDDEAINVLKNSPKWSPGIQNGVVVRTRYIYPLTARANK